MANEKRLIDANALKERAIRVSTVKEHCYMKAVGTHEIDKAPTVEAVEVVHARWEKCGGDLHRSGYAVYCSVCNKTHFVHYEYSLGGLYGHKELFEKPNYCPSCGAVMDGEI